MGIDKIALITPQQPSNDCFAFINDEYAKAQDERNFIFTFKYRAGETSRIDSSSQVGICTKPHINPFVRIDLNFKIAGSKEPPSTRIETNPNNFDGGWWSLRQLVSAILSDDFEDLRVTRLDLNADIEDVSVQYLRDSLRAPKKRKSGEIKEWKSKGAETFYVGRNPAKLRVYDKIQELKYKGEDVSQFPEVLTRIEWELHGDRILKCAGMPDEYGVTRPQAVLGKAKTQAFFFSELPVLRECQPFRSLEFIENIPYYDFRYDSAASLKRFTLQALSKKLGANDAIRVFNFRRNFSRDYKPILLDNGKLRERIEASYCRSIDRFFNNSGSSIRHIYRHSADRTSTDSAMNDSNLLI